MKKIYRVALATIVGLVLSGCSGSQPQPQPKFNPNNKGLKFIQGKPYSIPIMSCFTTEKPEIKAAVESKICKKNSVMWLSRDYVEKHNFPCGYNVSDAIKSQAKDIIAYKKFGLTGCATPLGKQEYEYMLAQQKQREENMRAIVNARAQVAAAKASAPVVNNYSPSSSGSNTVQCSKFGDLSFNKQIHTFNGMVCPLGYIKVY